MMDINKLIYTSSAFKIIFRNYLQFNAAHNTNRELFKITNKFSSNQYSTLNRIVGNYGVIIPNLYAKFKY